ncbi:MAG: cobalamin-binding protein [Gammaproteobacteria bacterium]|nr:cobalamin-binding protein [Gammaproteobacteria bacterium]
MQPVPGGVEVVDDAGQRIDLAQPAERIIALAPFLTELLFAAGAGAQVVAGVEYSDFPASAKTLPHVGDYNKFDVEKILALKPDLLVAWISGNPAKEVEILQRLGLTVLRSEPRSLEDVSRTLVLLGKVADTESHARRAARDFDARLQLLQAGAAGTRKLSVFYQVWDRPLITVNGQHLISDVLRRCGGRNVFAHLPNLAPRLDTEAVLRANPQVIIASGDGDRPPQWLDDWRRWPELQAVRYDNLYFVPPALIQRHTPRILQGMQRLCEQLALARAKL